MAFYQTLYRNAVMPGGAHHDINMVSKSSGAAPSSQWEGSHRAPEFTEGLLVMGSVAVISSGLTKMTKMASLLASCWLQKWWLCCPTQLDSGAECVQPFLTLFPALSLRVWLTEGKCCTSLSSSLC